MKITTPSYYLPTVEALIYEGLMESGTTSPMKVTAIDRETSIKNSYIVKPKNANRMSEQSSSFELLGAWMADELGIDVVTPVLVNISEEFTNTFIGKEGYQAATKSIGLNFGSLYQEGYANFINNNELKTPSLIDQARDIFTYDMLTSNADRRNEKPNMITNGKSLMVFDHELSFSYINLLSIFKNHKPWQIGPKEEEMYSNHIFYNLLREIPQDFNKSTEVLIALNDSFWNKVFEHMPSDWYSKDLDTIKEHTDLIIANKEEFADHLFKITTI